MLTLASFNLRRWQYQAGLVVSGRIASATEKGPLFLGAREINSVLVNHPADLMLTSANDYLSFVVFSLKLFASHEYPHFRDRASKVAECLYGVLDRSSEKQISRTK
jgi:hypothetical protein